MTSQPLLKLGKDCWKVICTINNFLAEVKKTNKKLIKLMIVHRKNVLSTHFKKGLIAYCDKIENYNFCLNKSHNDLPE